MPVPYNHAAAFVEFARGTPIPEIAMMLAIPEDNLRKHACMEKWTELVSNLPATIGPSDITGQRGSAALKKSEAQLRAIEHNRAKNLQLWHLLREDAENIIHALIEGRLKFKRYWHNKGSIVEKECEVTMADRNALANYLQVIAAGTYTALGDRVATGMNDKDATSGQASQAPTINIVLPNAINRPREQRNIVEITPQLTVETTQTVDAEVIDAAPPAEEP
jgi:hypothetical protein